MMKRISINFAVALLTMGGVFLSGCTKTETTPQTQVTGTNNTPNNNNPNNNNPDNNNPDNNTKDNLTYAKKTRPVFLEFTSTGCPGCGSWGKPTFKSQIKAHPDKVTPLAVHIKYGDPMITAESNAIGSNRHGQYYTPQLWVGDENGIVLNGGINGSASVQKMNQLINDGAAMVQPSLSAVVTKDGNNLKVTYGAKFIDIMASGEYGLACFLTEDGIEASQASSASNPTIHDHVIRTSAAGAFGKAFTQADLMDNEVSYLHNFDISAYNKDNVYVTVILWKKAGARYQPINGFVAK